MIELCGQLLCDKRFEKIIGRKHERQKIHIGSFGVSVLYIPPACFALGGLIVEHYHDMPEWWTKPVQAGCGAVVVMGSSFLPIWAFIPSHIVIDDLTVIDVRGVIHAYAAVAVFCLLQEDTEVGYMWKVLVTLAVYLGILFVCCAAFRKFVVEKWSTV